MRQADVAAVQFEPVPGDPAANVGRMADHLEALADEVRLAVFPELGVTGYDLAVAERLAEPVPGPTTDELERLAAEHAIDVVAGLPERAGASLYNDLVYVTPDGVEGRYRKRRLWGDEQALFDAGGEPTVVDSSFGAVGPLVCYDLNFPELSLAYAEQEVDVLVVSAAWRTAFLDDWELLLRARALDATSYVVGANHVGDQRGRDHGGHSMVVGPDGSVLEAAGESEERLTATMTPDELERARERNPVLRHRRQ